MDMHPAILVSDYILSKSEGRMTQLQVIKLAYIAHGYTLAILDRELIEDPVEAWKHGPMFRVVYSALRKYNAEPIPNLYYDNTKLDDEKRLKERQRFFEEIMQYDERIILDKVLKEYGDLTAFELIGITSEPGTPWSQYYVKGQRGTEIPSDAIRDYYTNLYNTAIVYR